MMRQVGLIASITDDDVLTEIMRTGKLGTSHGVSAADIARQNILWLGAHASAAAARVSAIAHSPAVTSPFARMALRVLLDLEGSAGAPPEAVSVPPRPCNPRSLQTVDITAGSG